jgi:hypothetical protein
MLESPKERGMKIAQLEGKFSQKSAVEQTNFRVLKILLSREKGLHAFFFDG